VGQSRPLMPNFRLSGRKWVAARLFPAGRENSVHEEFLWIHTITYLWTRRYSWQPCDVRIIINPARTDTAWKGAADVSDHQAYPGRRGSRRGARELPVGADPDISYSDAPIEALAHI
jgi:hypothetical protein